MSFYQTIAKQISTDEGQCVLLLGPELSVSKNGTYYKSYFKELAAANSGCINQYFEKENIFSFDGELGEDSMREKIFSYYENTGDETLLELVARIKFPLIINVFPDKSINRVYKKNHIDFVYDYLCSAEIPNNEALMHSYKSNNDGSGGFTEIKRTVQLETPSRDQPVIYNIFGDYEVTESMIYNHETFYETVEYLMAKDAIPEKIRTFIKKTNCFIFLGFDFDSWHYHLMCHKMGLGKKLKKLSYGSHIGVDERSGVSIIMKDYFKVSFVDENPTHTLQALINELNTNQGFGYSLRSPSINQHYSVFISYAWKNKEADILELVGTVLTNEKITANEKTAYLRELINKSGKHINPDTDLSWIIETGINDKGEKIEEWYEKLPASSASVSDQPKVLLYDREHVVNELEKKLQLEGITVFRDKNEMTYGDSIDSFMNRIGTGKAVVRVVSDKYLKSRYCMDEALRIHRYANKEQRIFTIVLKDDIDLDFAIRNRHYSDLNLADGDSIIYKQYWGTMVENIYGKINSSILKTIDKERSKKNFGIYIDIYDYIMDFITEIKDEVNIEIVSGTESTCLSIQQSKQFTEQEGKIDSFVKVIALKLKEKPENN